MKLWTATPYALDRNLGAEYNAYMDRIPEGDWMCFMDHDMMPTTRVWYAQFIEAIAFKPDAGALVAMANRIGPEWQRIGDRDCHDIAKHREFGQQRLKVRTLLDITRTKGFGGVMFAISKASWRAAGGFADGLLCVDHSLFFGLQKACLRSYVIESLYVYHWRRAFGDELPKDTPRAANCPCRGPETRPTVRLTLPDRSAAA